MPLEFDPEKKILKILPDYFTIQTANQGSTIVIVNETPSTLTPSSGKIILAIDKAAMHGLELSSGHDWSSENEYLILESEAGGPETLTFSANCPDLNSVIDHFNTLLSTANYSHSTYLVASKDTVPVDHLNFGMKTGYEGETHGFRIFNYYPSSLDASYNLGLDRTGIVGDSDTYEYTSFSGNTFYLKNSLNTTYKSSFPAAVVDLSYDALDIYKETQEWNDNQTNMQYLISMSAVGRFDLGAGVYTDIVYTFVNDWRIRFWPGNYSITLIGTVITSTGETAIVLPIAGNVNLIYKVGTAGVIARPTVVSSEQESIASKVWSNTSGAQVLTDTEILRKIETGRWKIQNNQMIIYKEDGVTPLYVFDLKDKAGKPTEETPYERVPV